MKRFFVAALFVFAFGATGAKAEEKSGTIENPRQIPDSITVSANRSETPLSQNASSVTIITEEEIAASQTEMVSDLLKQVPGLDVVQSGGLGKQTSVFLRGANSNHTLIIIDGVEMNDPTSVTNAFDFAHLNVNNIQRIEILRGPQSVLYGSDAIGGVINIITKRGFGTPKVELTTEAGSYNTYSEAVHVSGSNKKLDYSLFLSRKDSDGFSAVKDGNEKDGYKNTDISTQVGIQLAKYLELTLNSRFNEGTVDIDQSFGILDDPNYMSQNKVNSLGVKLKSFNPSRKWFQPELRINLFHQESNSVNEEDEDHFGESSVYNANGDKLKISLLNPVETSSASRTLVGIEYEEEKFESDYESITPWFQFQDVIPEKSAKTFSYFALSEMSISNDWLITAGLRYDDHDNFGVKGTFRFTSRYQMPEIGVTLKGTYGNGFKSPSLYQLTHPLYGNVDLRPEESKGWEIGFDKYTQESDFGYGIMYFSNTYNDLIGYDDAFRSINVGKAKSEGVELFSQFTLNNSTVRFDYTYTKFEDLTNGNNMLRRPEHKFVYTIDHRFSARLKGRFQMISIGERQDTDFNSWPYQNVVLEEYTLVNLKASYTLFDFFTLNGRIDNLFDEQYEEILTYATPGLTVYLGGKFSL